MLASSAQAVGWWMLMVGVCTEFTETDENTEIARHEGWRADAVRAFLN
jgi:hypothetical protein